jgi:hypothetical protein
VKIQRAYYGHALAQDLQAEHARTDEQRFAYPIYVVFLMAPSVPFDFGTVHRWVPLALALLVGSAVILCLDILTWRPAWEAVAALALFTIGSPEIVQGLRLRQLGLLVGFLIVLAAWFITKGRLACAGLILALSTIKPQMMILPLVWFLIWTAGRWRERWQLAAGFIIGLAVLIGMGEFVLPGWISSFISGVHAYKRYVVMKSLLDIALGDLPSQVLSGIFLLAILCIAWQQRKSLASSPGFVFTLCFVLLAEAITFPLFPPFNQVLLLLPAMMVFRHWGTHKRILRSALAFCLGWPWVASLGLLLIASYTRSFDQPALLPSACVGLIPLLLLVLTVSDWRSEQQRFIAEQGLHGGDELA